MAGSEHSKQRRQVMTALEQHEGALMRFAARMCGDQETANDVVQHAFLQLCDQQDGQFPEDPRPWLFKVCRNRILDLQRKSGRAPESLEGSDDLLSGSEPDPATLAERKDLSNWLRTLVDQLPVSQREVIVLWSEGLPYGQIAEITNQKEGGVRVKAHRGFVRLRQHPAVRALMALDGADPVGRGQIAANTPLSQKDRVS